MFHTGSFNAQVPPKKYSSMVLQNLPGGSRVDISGVISPLSWVITLVTLLITPLITTHEPPSKPQTLNPKPQTLNP